MGDARGRRRRRWAGRLLGPWVGRVEAEAIARDLEELARRRGTVWFWRSLAAYPVRLILDGIRADADTTTRGRGAMDGWSGDLRHAVRGLLRAPGFTFTAAAILACAVGAFTALYGVVHGVLLEPLPYHRAESLHALWLEAPDGTRGRMTPGHARAAVALEAFDAGAIFQGASASLGGDGASEFVRGGRVTPGYFATLGIPLALGREFEAEEGDPGAAPVAILGHGLWQRAFGEDPRVVGTFVELDGRRHQVVGVAGPGLYPTSVLVSAEIPFTGTAQDYFVPLSFSSEFWGQHRSHILGTVVRRAPGTSVEAAQEALRALGGAIGAADPVAAGEGIVLTPLADEIVGDVRSALLLLLTMAALVLIIAVVNVGALFTLRADDRAPEVDLRRTLGAPWSRIVRGLVTESAVVVALAAAGALGVARLMVEGMRRAVPYSIPRMDEVGLDAGVLAVATALAALLAVGFGTAPAWRLFRRTRGSGTRTVAGSRRSTRLQGGVVAVQSALGVVVLVGAVLLVRSFVALRAVDPGFEARDAWVFQVSGAGEGIEAILEGVRGLAGVASAAATYDHPLERNWVDGFRLPGVPVDDRSPPRSASLRPVGDGYFDAIGVGAVEGDLPDAALFSGPTRVAVINEAFRDRFFGEDSPLGQVLEVPTAERMAGEDAGDYVIAAVVENVRFRGPGQEVEPAFYLPLRHFPAGASTLVVRPRTPGAALSGPVGDVVRRIAPGAAIRSASRLSDLMDDLLARPRFNMMLVTALGVLGLALCGLGAYGLTGRAVASRRREIGIRMALGARSGGVFRLVLGAALRPLGVGVCAGLLAAWLATGTLRSLLFGVGPGDPASFVGAAVFMVVVAVAAAALPTARALTTDPVGSLRAE